MRELDLPHHVEYPDTVEQHLSWLNRAIRLDEEFAQAYARKALVLADIGRPDNARPSAELALDHGPELGVAHLAMAETQEGMGQWDEAFDSYTRAVEHSPHDAKILGRFARFLSNVEKQKRAEEMAEGALELSPADYEVLILYFQVIQNSASDRRDEMADVARRVIDAEPTFPGGYFFLAAAELRLGNIDEAGRNIDEAESLWQAPPAWGMALLAYFNGRVGHAGAAREWFDRYMTAFGPDAYPEYSLYAYLGIGDEDGARDALVALVAGCPDSCGESLVNARNITDNGYRDRVLDTAEFAELRSRIVMPSLSDASLQ